MQFWALRTWKSLNRRAKQRIKIKLYPVAINILSKLGSRHSRNNF